MHLCQPHRVYNFAEQVHQCQWWITACHNHILFPFPVAAITNSTAFNLRKLKCAFSFFGDTTANKTLGEQIAFLWVHLPKATASKSALCYVPMRTCRLPTKVQHSPSWSSCLSLLSTPEQEFPLLLWVPPPHWAAGSSTSCSRCCFSDQGGWALWKISFVCFLCWNTHSLHMGCGFVSEINSNITDCPFLDSSTKDVVHLSLCLLAKLPVGKHSCGCGYLLWKSHHVNAKYHPIWFIYTYFFFWLCTALVQWQPS